MELTDVVASDNLGWRYAATIDVRSLAASIKMTGRADVRSVFFLARLV